jgi:hypothetical protein
MRGAVPVRGLELVDHLPCPVRAQPFQRQGRSGDGAAQPLACRGDEATLPSVVDLVGDDYLTFNTDYPHPDGMRPSGIERLEKQPISQASIRKIFWDNAAGVFGVK